MPAENQRNRWGSYWPSRCFGAKQDEALGGPIYRALIVFGLWKPNLDWDWCLWTLKGGPCYFLDLKWHCRAIVCPVGSNKKVLVETGILYASLWLTALSVLVRLNLVSLGWVRLAFAFYNCLSGKVGKVCALAPSSSLARKPLKCFIYIGLDPVGWFPPTEHDFLLSSLPPQPQIPPILLLTSGAMPLEAFWASARGTRQQSHVPQVEIFLPMEEFHGIYPI